MAQVTFTVEFSDDGKALIRLPDGKTQQVDASKIAEVTDALSKKLGLVLERHIGSWHHGIHTHQDGTTHEHQGSGK